MQSLLNKQKILETFLDSYTCTIAGCNTVTNSSRNMLSHLNVYHNEDINFTSPCLFSTECFHLSNFKSYGGLYRHLKSFHPSFFYSSTTKQSQLIEVCTETEIVNNNSGIEIGK
jgi:hypothetical protein